VWDHHLEFRWIEWDRSLLYGWGFQRAIESLGALLLSYLEFCYLSFYPSLHERFSAIAIFPP
jgi:hypothetical protein